MKEWVKTIPKLSRRAGIGGATRHPLTDSYFPLSFERRGM
jgi:hypothetical protein